MAKFTFALPDGKLFELTGPADATIAQAERIFLEQMSAGAFVGLRDGDVLENAAATLVKFNLSRLDRGTAATADLPLLAINNAGIISSLPLLGNVQVENGIVTADFAAQTPAIDGVGPLTPTQVQAIGAQIRTAVNQLPNVITTEKGIGAYGFSSEQLEKAGYLKPGTSCRFLGLSNQPPVENNNNTAVQPSQATPADNCNTGSRIAVPNPDNFVSVMSSPAVWTGKDNVREVTDLLSNYALQDKIQYQLITDSYNDLVETGEIVTPATDDRFPVGEVYVDAGTSSSGLIESAGVGLALGALSKLDLNTISSTFSGLGDNITSIAGKIGNINLDSLSLNGLTGLSLDGLGGSIDKAIGSISSLANRGAAELGGLLSNASKFGVDTATAWAKGLLPSSSLTSQLDGLAKQGQFAINFADFKLPTVVSGVAPAAAFTNTINRQTVDLATAKIIGSPKIPTPSFGGISIDDTLSNLPAQAQSLLKGASSLTGIAGQISGAAGGLLNQATGLAGQAAGALSGLANTNLPGVPSLAGLTSSMTNGIPNASALTAGLNIPNTASLTSGVSKLGGSSLTNLIGTNTTDPTVLAQWNSNFERSLIDPNAPEYTGTDNTVRARLGLPPVDQDGNLLA